MLYLCKLQENRCLYLVCYLKGNLLPPPWPFKDNDGGCVSSAECTIMVLCGRILNYKLMHVDFVA